MNINQLGLDLIKRFEGFRAEPYPCSAKVWTIGYGATRAKNGKPVTEDTPPMTKEEAEELLKRDVAEAERAVSGLVTCELSSNQFSALVSLVFNIGQGKFKRSKVLKCLNAGAFAQAMVELREWRMADGEVVAGLERRRKAEQQLFEGKYHE